MPAPFNVAAALGQPDPHFDAWQFIRDFAATWVTPIDETDGFSAEEIDAAEARLGLRLPAAVRQGYLLFGRRTQLTSQHGTLYPPEKLSYDDDHQVLVFRTAHQGVASYGVSLADPEQQDPPVLVRLSMMDTASESWEPFIDRFSLACVDILLSERVEGGELSDGRDLLGGEPASFAADLTQAVVPRYLGSYSGGQWYATEDVILRVEDDAWVAVGARTADALDSFRTEHPGDWVNEY